VKPVDKVFDDLCQRFTPSDDDKFMFKDTKDQIRLIFPTNDGYTDEEEQKLKELAEYLE
jgi:hypothetical protein